MRWPQGGFTIHRVGFTTIRGCRHSTTVDGPPQPWPLVGLMLWLPFRRRHEWRFREPPTWNGERYL